MSASLRASAEAAALVENWLGCPLVLSAAGPVAPSAVLDAIRLLLPPREREEAMVVLRRNDNGEPTIWCDPGISSLVKALNDAGIATLASCSGHGRRPGNIALADGRELIVARDYHEARTVEAHFPGVNGERPLPAPPEGYGA